VYHGFIYDSGNYTAFDAPGATNGTWLTGFNDMHEVVGYYADAAGTHGFVYDNANGTFTALDDPMATNGTYAAAINDSGQVVGTFYPISEHGFLAVPS
jgi:uncharacterized membrane protein